VYGEVLGIGKDLPDPLRQTPRFFSHGRNIRVTSDAETNILFLKKNDHKNNSKKKKGRPFALVYFLKRPAVMRRIVCAAGRLAFLLLTSGTACSSSMVSHASWNVIAKGMTEQSVPLGPEAITYVIAGAHQQLLGAKKK
jgi:hypothetical protein